MQETEVEDPRGFVPDSAFLRQKAREAERFAKQYERLAQVAEEFESGDDHPPLDSGPRVTP